MNLDTLRRELSSRLNIDHDEVDAGTNELFSMTELDRWLNFGKDEAAARYPWPLTEGKGTMAAVASTEEYDYPSGMKSDSITLLRVGNKRYKKLLFVDYLKYLEDSSSSAKKIYSDNVRTIYINTNAFDGDETIEVWGQVKVADFASTLATTFFDGSEPEGDESIIKLAFAKALSSDKKKNPAGARKERLEALEILDGIWARIAERQHSYLTQDRPLFQRLNVIEGELGEDSESQF